jgi:hypothetical protein
LNGPVSKTVRGLWVPRGFESHPLRFKETLLVLHPKAGAVVGLLWTLRVIATTRRESRTERPHCPLLPRTGPFAWDGLLVIWSPLTLFGL